MKERILPVLLLLLAMASIQFGASVAKQLFPIAGVAGASSLRLFFAALVLIVAFRPWKVPISKKSLTSLFFYGASLGLMNLSFYFALERIPLGIAVALEFIGPLAVAVISGQKKSDYLWASLAAIGIYLLLPLEDTQTALDPMGIFYALLAGFFWAIYILFGKKAGTEVSGGVAASVGMGIAAVVVLPWGLLIDMDSMFQTTAVPLGMFVGLFGSAIPYSLEMSALKKMPSQTFSVLMSMEPAMAAIMGLIFLGEVLTTTQWFAVVCVIVSSQGSALSSRPIRKTSV
ncbi:MAG: DMT family transporter [Bacteriovoracaceae bacterium]|nr:DMT family transporter [Bacteriovoracaceae bacterium]